MVCAVGKGDQPRSTYPKRKAQTSIKWTQGPATALWRGRFIGKTTDVANAVKGPLTKEIFYQDAEVGYSFDKYETAITLGVNNIANLQAPRSYANAPINYDIYTYDERGRSFYVRLSAAF